MSRAVRRRRAVVRRRAPWRAPLAGRAANDPGDGLPAGLTEAAAGSASAAGQDATAAVAEVPRAAGPGATDAALDELRASLARSPREIPSKYLYDDRGSALFEQITALPEYYPTRTEAALLERAAPQIAAAGGAEGWSDLVELGSGAAIKTVALLRELLRQGARPRYVAVDISAHALERTREILAARAPGVPVVGLQADYGRDLALPPHVGRGARLVLFLGGTIGNEEDQGAVALLSRVRAHIDAGDALLLGASLVTDPAVIEAAYDDAQGVTAAFNRNVLAAVNRLAGSGFDPEAFDHCAPWVPERARIEMWLRARAPLVVPLGRLGGALRLRAGEGIRTEISRRFTREGLERLLRAAGFAPERWLPSDDGRFALALARAWEGPGETIA